MARGFLSGAIWGAVLSIGVASVTSIYVGAPSGPVVGDAAPNATSAPETGSDGQTAPAGDSDLVQDSASLVAQPEADSVDAVAEAGSDVPTLPETGGADGLEAPVTPTTDGSVSVDGETPVLPSPQSTVPTAPANDSEASISTDPAQPLAPSVPDSETAFEPETPEVVAPDVAAETDSTRPAIGRPAGSLIDQNANDPATETTTPTDTTAVAPGATRPIDAFAAEFKNPLDKPLMSIILIDSGADLSGGTVGVAALRSFPAPITFAVKASLPDAADRMARYRAEGFEVLAMIDLPEGATATDAEVTLNSVLNTMNEVVGVIEGVDVGVQQDREASDQMTQILAQSGHGLVTQSKGLNTVQKLAAREGVPSAVVFRDFDSADQTPTVIRRFLDQAAFRADQEGGVIMLGRLRPDTISALLLWGLADRAERVTMVPVSAVLKQRAAETE
jgi:polysaccharide deacetylase 2 family uncharacterized protein YibQ